MATTHEKQTYAPVSPELERAHLFEKAQRELYSIVSDVEEQYEEKGIDPTEVKKGTYWLAVADHANRVVNERYSTLDTLEYGQLLQLTALAPVGFLAQRALAALSHPSHGEFTSEDHDRRQSLVVLASRNVEAAAMYARSNQDLSAHDLNSHLTETIEKTLEFPKEATLHSVAEFVRGVQHEVACGYLLSNQLETRISNQEEDIQGADYVVRQPNGKGAMVDIKSSLGGIAAENGDTRNGWTIHKGRIVVASPLETEDLDGKFYPTGSAVRTKGPLVGAAVNQALTKARLLRNVVY